MIQALLTGGRLQIAELSGKHFRRSQGNASEARTALQGVGRGSQVGSTAEGAFLLVAVTGEASLISGLLQAVITGGHVIEWQDVKVPWQGVAHALVRSV